VPHVRGPEKSVPMGRVLAEVNVHETEGFQEVVLTGTEVGSYCDGETRLIGLLQTILSETRIPRIRLSSLQPSEVTPELIGLWQDQRLCPHFHLSLQSGCDATLRRMRRRYSPAGYKAAVRLIRSALPDAAITTDVIVGFPGETADEFEASLDFCRQHDFARIHVFPFSARTGTEAATTADQVDERTKRARTNEMLRLARESAAGFKRRCIGQTRAVLWEQRNARGLWTGLTDNYIPVTFRSDEDLTNRITEFRLA
jgi:threonylcarbamoyladenosine tRNA methylthiotransferase MtaB